MSHYAVAVFTKDEEQDVRDLLAPYYEGIEMEPYISMTKAELIQWGYDNHSKRQLCNETVPEPKTDEEAFEFAMRFHDSDSLDEDGNLTSTYNPNSKWDWYSVGGRWGGLLTLKKEVCEVYGVDPEDPFKVNMAMARDVDFEAMREEKLLEIASYESIFENSFYKEEYLRELYPDEETYRMMMSTFHTYAVLTPDGVWHAPGEMGWFGRSTESGEESQVWARDFYKNFIQPAIDGDWGITIVDCHI